MIDIDPQAVYRGLLESGTAWAEAHSMATQLEDGQKPLLAQLTVEAKERLDCSITEAEKHALSSDAYREAIREAVEARRDANIAKVKYTAVQTKWEAIRTAEASHRAANHAAR